MKRLVAVLALVGLAVGAWLMWTPDVGHAPVGTEANVASVPPSPDAPKPRAPRVRDEAPRPAPDSETPAPSAADKEADVPATTYPLTVTVLRSDGTPGVGAAVVLLDPDGYGDTTASGRTDAEGRAVLRADEDPVRVVAWLDAEAGAPQDLVSPKEQSAVTVRLGASVVVHGRVTLHGEPVEGADVRVSAQPWFKSEFGLVLTERTNAAGEFRTSPIPEAGIDPLKPPTVEARTADLAKGSAVADMEAVRRGGEVVVELRSPFSIRARFLDGDAKPLAGVVVCATSDPSRLTPSDADGRIEMRMRHVDKTTLVAHRPAARRRAVPSAANGGTRAAQWSTAKSLGTLTEPRGTIDLGDVVLAPGRPVKGVVVDSAGRPSSHAQVAVYLDGVEVASTTADDAGAFVLPEIGPDPHRIAVRERLPDDSTGVARTKLVDGVKGGDPDLRIVLDDVLAIVVHFLSETDRKPLACSTYSVRVKLHGDGFDWFGTQIGAGEDVSHVVTVFMPGSYDVEVDATGYEPQRFESVEVVAGRPPSLDLLLRKKAN